MNRLNLIFGAVAVEKGVMTLSQVTECSRLQREAGPFSHIGEISFQKGYIDRAQLKRILYLQQARFLELEQNPEETLGDHLFSQVAGILGYVGDEDIQKALEIQEESESKGIHLPVSEIFLDLNLFGREQVQDVLNAQGDRALVCRLCLKVNDAAKLVDESKHECPLCQVPLNISEDEWANLTREILETVDGTISGVGNAAMLAAATSPDDTLPVRETDPDATPIWITKETGYEINLERAVRSRGGLATSEFGHYRVIRCLGVGGMGAVYLCENTLLRKDVALKVLLGEVKEGSVAWTRFRAEARAGGQFRSPYLVEVYGVSTVWDPVLEINRPCIEMEYVKGKALRDRLEEGPMPLDEAVRVMEMVCTGVVQAHEKSIIHRDLKPQNILVSDEGDAKVMDFGLALLPDSVDLTMHGEIMGTPTYMAPEQCHSSRVDERADIYALGATFYHMVSGRKPFIESNPLRLLNLKLTSEPKSIREWVPDLPESLVSIIERMMAFEPSDRYSSIHEIIDDIRAFRGGEVIKYVTRRRRKSRITGMAAGLIGVAIGLGISGATYLMSPAETIKSDVSAQAVTLVSTGGSLEKALGLLDDARSKTPDLQRQEFLTRLGVHLVFERARAAEAKNNVQEALRLYEKAHAMSADLGQQRAASDAIQRLKNSLGG